MQNLSSVFSPLLRAQVSVLSLAQHLDTDYMGYIVLIETSYSISCNRMCNRRLNVAGIWCFCLFAFLLVFVCLFFGWLICFFCFLVASSWLTSNQVLVKGNGMNSKLERQAIYPFLKTAFRCLILISWKETHQTYERQLFADKNRAVLGSVLRLPDCHVSSISLHPACFWIRCIVKE